MTKSAGTFSRGRRWSTRLNILAAVLLALYNVVLLNLIIFRHPVRVDLTQEGLHSLSDETRAKLKLVNENVRVLVAYYYQPRNVVHWAHVQVLDRALRLLKEFHAVQPLVAVETHINVFEEADRWTALCAKFGLSPTQYNRVIFIAGEGSDSFKQTLTPAELALFLPLRDKAVPPKMKEFRGEQAITSAITKLTNRTRKKVYFTQGHGELALRPGKEQLQGLAALRHDLESSGFEAEEVSLARYRKVPEDCSLLIAAGPEQRFSPRELDIIEDYLLHDGRLLVALGSRRTGIEDILDKWGTKVLEGEVTTRILLPGQRVDRSWVIAGKYNASHPIATPFQNAAQFETRFWLPRPLKLSGGQRTMMTQALLSTGENSENERFLLVGGDLESSDEASERGEFVVATVTMGETLARPPPKWKQRKTRIVVVSSSNFLRDAQDEASVRGGYLSASHRDLFMNSVYWLVGEENLAAAGGRETLTRTLPTLDAPLKRFLFVASVLIFPGVFALIGVGVYFLRRV